MCMFLEWLNSQLYTCQTFVAETLAAPYPYIWCMQEFSFRSNELMQMIFIYLHFFCFCILNLQQLILHFAYLDAQWFSREDVRKALTFAKYKQAQRTAAEKVEQMCKGLEKNRSLASDLNVESADEQHASIVVPGPFAIAYHLISSWAFSDQNVVNGVECNSKNPSDL